MNELSWLIYLAGVTGYLSGWLMVFPVITFVGAIAVTIWTLNPDSKPPRPMYLAIPLFIFFLIASCIVPDRNTVLAIAASEMGEKVLATPQAQRVGEALTNWINDQIKPEKDDSK